jgi:hypothetical protein
MLPSLARISATTLLGVISYQSGRFARRNGLPGGLLELRADAKCDELLKAHLVKPSSERAAASRVDHDKRRFSSIYLTLV